ncbi:MAG: PPOX class F420-dependent oxidoreductase [Ardenticatenaceae bacterium]
MFSATEIAYLNSQRLARIATVSSAGQPDVVPVGFEFDGAYFYVGGRNPTKTLKHKNVQAGNTRVALAIDDLPSVNLWRPRGIKVHGTAEIVERRGYAGPGPYLKITPTTARSWVSNRAARFLETWQLSSHCRA